MRNNRLVINSIYYTIGEILPRIIGFILLPLLTRCLSPTEYGMNSYTNTVMLFSFAFSALSLNTFLLRNYYKEPLEGRRRLIGSVFCATLGVNAVVSGIELLIFPWLIVRMKIGVPFHPIFLLAILNNFLEGFALIPLVIYRIKQNARLFVVVNASKTILQFVATFLLLTVGHYGLTGVYVARLIVNIPYAILFVIIIRRNAVFSLDKTLIRQGLAFSLPLLPGALSYLFISTFDRIVLEKNIGLAALGLYAVASTLALTLNIIVQGLYRTFEQKIFEKHGTDEYPEVADTLYKYFIICLTTGGFLLSIFSKEVFIILTSAKYQQAYELVPSLTISVIIAGLGTFLGTFLIASQKQRTITKGTTLSVVVTLGGTLILIRLIGVYGAIVTSIVSFLVVYFIYLADLRLRNSYIPQTLLLLAILLATCLGFQQLDIPFWSALGIKTCLSAAYFWLCIRLLKVNLSRIEI